MYHKILKCLFIFICACFIFGCSEKNEDLSNDNSDITDNQDDQKVDDNDDKQNDDQNDDENITDGGGDKTDDDILTVEYEKIMYYGEELDFKVFSKYSDDEIEVESSNDEIVFLILNKTNEYTIIACELGNVDIKITSKYGEELIVTVEVKAKEGYAPPISAMEISMREAGPYYVNQTYHIDYVIEEEIYNDSFKFFTSQMYEVDLDTMEIIFKRAGEVTVTSMTLKEGVKSSFQIDVEFNPEVEVYDLFFVGNSFTYYHEIPTIVTNMIKADGTYVNFTQLTVGGAYLSDHTIGFNKHIKEVKYTHVILQDQSRGPIDKYDNFRNTVLEYNNLIKENGAKLVLYQTWGYNTEYKYSMAESLKEAYQSLADETNSMISRVGDAFVKYEKDYTDLPILYDDMSHQSKYGAYLSACVHYATITGRKASDNTYVNEKIESEFIKIIQEIADKVVFSE